MLCEKGSGLIDSCDRSADVKKSLRATALRGLATVASQRANWDAAEGYLRDWITIFPDNANAYSSLAAVLFNKEQFDEAYATYQTAKAKNSTSVASAEVLMGQLYARSGDMDGAIEWMKKAIDTSPDDIKTLVAVAFWYLQNDKLEEALTQAAAAYELDQDSLDAKLLRGLAARYLRKNDEAEEFFELAHLQKPGNRTAVNQLALVLIESDDEEKRRRAVELAQMNHRQYPDGEDTIGTLGWVYYRHKKLNEARQYFDKLLQVLQSGRDLAPDTKYFIACLNTDLSRSDVATVMLQQALASDKTFAYRNEAEALKAKLGKPE